MNEREEGARRGRVRTRGIGRAKEYTLDVAIDDGSGMDGETIVAVAAVLFSRGRFRCLPLLPLSPGRY